MIENKLLIVVYLESITYSVIIIFLIILNVLSQMELTVLHKLKNYFQIYFEPTKYGHK